MSASLDELAPKRGPGCPPKVTLEAASAGDWAEGVRAHVDGCAECQTQLAQLTTLQRDFLAARPTERFLQQLETRRQPSRRPRWLAPVLSLAAVALVVALLPKDHGSGVTLKGLSTVSLKRGTEVTPAGIDTRLAPGDALRFTVHAPTDGYAVVLERDGAGHVSVVAPFDAKAPHFVNAGTSELPDSAVLDEVRGRDTFFTVFAPQPFRLEPLLEALSRDEAPRCDGCSVEASTFDKP